MLAGADEEVDADADAEADVDVGGEVVVEVAGDVDVVGDVVVARVVGDEYVLAGCDVYGADVDALGDADGSVVADVTAGPTDAGAVDVCPAGCSSRMDGCPVNEFTANAAAPPAPTTQPRMSASTSGFNRRRRGGWPVPAGMGGGVAGG
ncbi:MAG: hypothetical protein ACXVHC_05595 [Frankiaceae bacterium]